MGFSDKLRNAIGKNKSYVCVGLDIDPARLPDHLTPSVESIIEFNTAIIKSTSDLVCAYKPNMAFYEAMGSEGDIVLRKTLSAIPDHIPVILDAKRGDIGNTAAQYAKAIFEDYRADATTLSPYMGYDSVEPFLRYQDKTSFILCLTSNKGSSDFQKQKVGERYLYEVVAEKCFEWNSQDNVGLVVGATNPEEIAAIRNICPTMPFLIPGVGAQGGSIEASVGNGLTATGQIIINSSRGILYASRGRDYAERARQAAEELRHQIYTVVNTRISLV